MHSSVTFVALFGLLACFALNVSAHGSPGNIEEKFAVKFGNGKIVKWDQVSKLTNGQLVEMCSSVHQLTGHGPAEIKEAKVVGAYLKFDNRKYKPNFTQVLSCKENNAHEHTFYVTQGVDNTALTLIHPEQRKIKGKDVFGFTVRSNVVRAIPTLLKLSA